MRPLITLLSLMLATGLSGQTLVNPSFENGQLPWVLSPGTEIRGPVSASGIIGVDGSHVAQLGLSGVSNAYIYQTINLFPQTTYQLTFSLGASTSGHEARVRVRATNSTAGVFGSNVFAVFSQATSPTNGYARHNFQFTTPAAAGTNLPVVLIFSDASTNQGVLDPRLDFMVLTQTSFPLLTNGGFENGLTYWPVNPGVTVYGPPDFPQIGTEGSFAAALGAGDAAGSRLEYHMAADAGATYQLTFDLAAMGAAGFRAISLLEIITQPGGTVFSQIYTNTANGTTPFGRPPFQAKVVNFSVPGTAGNMIIRFSDQSPNGGFGVDPILDNVQLSLVSSPPGINFYAGIAVKGIVGRAYALDYSDDVGTGVTNWVRMTNLTLNVSPTLIFDITSTNRLKRFYRTVAQ